MSSIATKATNLLSTAFGGHAPEEKSPMFTPNNAVVHADGNLMLEKVNDLDDNFSDLGSEENPIINDVESLRKGTLKLPDGRRELTLLVVGETGVGKTVFLSLLANVLSGRTLKDYGLFHDQENEAGGTAKNSQTNSAHLYHFTSQNGIKLHILDTPGLADTRGIMQDELHKRSIAECIQKNIPVVDAVLILANGTAPRLSVSTDYALSALSSIFPRTIVDNICFLFTNVSTPMSWNFDESSIPARLQNSPRFLLDNPVPLWKKYLEQKQRAGTSTKVKQRMKHTVEQCDQAALETLADMFDWLSSLSPQPSRDILDLYEKSQSIEMKIANILSLMHQITDKQTRINDCLANVGRAQSTMQAFQNFETIVREQVYTQEGTPQYNMLCTAAGCHSNCHVDCGLSYKYWLGMWWCSAIGFFGSCKRCGHITDYHRHFYALWTLTDDEKVDIDEDARAKFNNAKDEKAQYEQLVDVAKRAMNDFSICLDQLTEDLKTLAQNYAGLSLSGSFSGQVRKAVSLMEHHLEAMRQDGTDGATIWKVEESLKSMRKKLDVLARAQKREDAEYEFVPRGPGWGNFRG